MSPIKPVELWALDEPLEPVRFTKGGPEYAMVPLDGIGEQLAMSLAALDSAQRLETLRKIVQRCIPTAPPEEVAALSSVKLDFLIGLATEQVKSVEEYLGKFSPRTPGDTASKSETPLAGRSAGSRKRKAGATAT